MADKLKETIARGHHAQSLLEDPLFVEAWRNVEADIHSLWATSPSTDSEGRETLYRELHALKAVRARLESTIKAGKLAEKELEHVKNGN